MSSYLGDTKATNLSVGYGGSTSESYNEAKLTVNGGWLQIYNFGHTLKIGAENSSWSHIYDTGNVYLNAAGFALDVNTYPYYSNTYNLGDSSHLWKGVYATNFYENGTALSSKYATLSASTSSDTTGISAKATGGAVSIPSHSHGIADNGHYHSFTPAGTNKITTTSTKTGGVSTEITATSSQPSFTGTSHTHVLTDETHKHGYQKTTAVNFTGKAGTTGSTAPSGSLSHTSTNTGSATVTTATVTNPTITITEPNNNAGHYHTYDKAKSSASVSVSGKSGNQSASGVTVGTATESTGSPSSTANVINSATYDSSSYCLSFGTVSVASGGHTHAYTAPSGVGTMANHTHTTTSTGTATITYDSVYTGTTKAGVTATASGTAVTMNAHTHTYDKATSVSVGSHTHSFTPAGTNAIEYNGGKTDEFAEVTTINDYAPMSISAATAGGTVSTPKITVSGAHTHTYDKTTDVAFTGTAGSTGSSATGVTINSASITPTVTQPTITITDPGHKHTQK